MLFAMRSQERRDLAGSDILKHRGSGKSVGQAPEEFLLVPERLPAERWVALSVFAVSLIYLSLFRKYTAIDPDEGIILQGAQRIVEGQVLYRDFFSYFTPGSYYLLALIFKIFGSSLVVARTALAFYGAGISVFSYFLARRVCTRRIALTTTYLVLLTGLPWRFLILHNWDSTLLACGAVYCALWLIQAPNWGWAFAAGSLTSLTFLFEQSKGGGLGLGFLLALGLIAFFAPGTLRLSRRQWLGLGLGLALPFVLTFAYFALHQALGALLVDWFWPLNHYSRVNKVPYGYMDWSDQARKELYGSGPWVVRAITLFTISPLFLIPVLPIIALALLIYWLREAHEGSMAPDRAAYYILMSSSIVGLLISVLISRADIIHFVHLIPFLYLVLAWLMEGTDIRSGLLRWLKPLVTLGVLLSFSGLGLAFLVKSRSARTLMETRRGPVMVRTTDQVVEYLQAHVPQGSSDLLIYPYMPLYYYLTAILNPTSYDYFQPGMQTPEQEQDVVHQIATARTPMVLFQPAFNDVIAAAWPNTSIKALAGDPVADYVLAHYRPCVVLASSSDWNWRFVFMVRKDLICPN